MGVVDRPCALDHRHGDPPRTELRDGDVPCRLDEAVAIPQLAVPGAVPGAVERSDELAGHGVKRALDRDRLREVVVGLRGDRVCFRGRNFGGIRLTHDLGEGLGGLASNDPLSSRQAGGGFTKVNLDLGRVQRFNEELYAIFRGHHQAAFNPLPFAEQYGLGGINTVRGYVQSAYLADSGYNLNAELRWAPWKKYRDNFELGFFYDHGGAYLKRPFPGEVENIHLNGAGVGVHLKLPHDVNVRAEVGVPLSDNEITRRDGKNAVPYLIFNKRF